MSNAQTKLTIYESKWQPTFGWFPRHDYWTQSWQVATSVPNGTRLSTTAVEANLSSTWGPKRRQCVDLPKWWSIPSSPYHLHILWSRRSTPLPCPQPWRTSRKYPGYLLDQDQTRVRVATAMILKTYKLLSAKRSRWGKPSLGHSAQ